MTISFGGADCAAASPAIRRKARRASGKSGRIADTG
jgi:hypothetical protein